MKPREKIKQRLPEVNTSIIDGLSDEQAEFIVHPLNESCFLSACPGSGKTHVVGIKTAFEISGWNNKFSGIAVLSFTKNAAKEIAERVAKFGSINATKHPHFIGTIDSWLHSFILNPFGHKVTGYQGRDGDKSFILVDSTERSENYPFLISFQTDHQSKRGRPDPIQVNNFYFTFDGQPEHLKIDFSQFNLSKKQQLIDKKNNFLKAGLCTYQDAEYICYKLLKDNNRLLGLIAQRFPFIIIDECQDLSQSQIRLFHLLKEKGVHLFLIGDINQAIYDFRKVYVDKLLKFIKHWNISEKKLTDNYRSNQYIVDACIKLSEKINLPENIIKITGKESIQHENNLLLWKYENVQDLPRQFIEIINERGLSIMKSAILGRGHSLLKEFRPDTSSEYKKIELFANALNCWNVPNRTGKDMQNALHQIGKSLCYLAYEGKGNHQHQYLPEGVSQVEWRLFLHDLLIVASEADLYHFGQKTWSDWAACLKLFLKGYWDKLPSAPQKWDIVNAKIRGSTTNKVIDEIKSNTSDKSEKVRITTIHNVKGETFDAVLLVSSEEKKGQKTGRHFTDWISSSPEHKEFVRLAYVASSRPKHLLIWAIPQNTNSTDENTIIDLGFVKHTPMALLPTAR